MENTW